MKWRGCVLAALAAVGCGSPGGVDESKVEGLEIDARCPEDSTLSYETFGREFMENYCVSCHTRDLGGAARKGAPTDHDFDTLEDVREHVDHIALTAAAGATAVNTAMPPGARRPNREERRLLGEWLACGAP